MPGYYQKAATLVLSALQRALLEQIVGRTKSQQRHVTRGRIILMASSGAGNQEIADALSVSRRTVYHWRSRWCQETDRLTAIDNGSYRIKLR